MEKLRFSDLDFQIKDEERKLGHQTAAVALEYTYSRLSSTFSFLFFAVLSTLPDNPRDSRF